MRPIYPLVLLFSAFISGCGGSSAPAPISTPQVEAVNMPAGFQVVGDHGVIQVDENIVNFGLLSKGTVTTSGKAASVTVQNTKTPILCVKSPNAAVSLFSLSQPSSGTTTYNLRTDADATVEWFAFDQMPAASSGAGMQVYTAAGALAFDSGGRVMKVMAAQKLPDISTTSATPTVVNWLPSGDYAACLSSSRVYSDGENQIGLHYRFQDALKTSSNGASVNSIFVEYWPAPPRVYQGTGGYLFIVDVSGL